MSAPRPTVFLDRDGTINRDHGYVHRWQDFEFAEGALEGLQLLASRQLVVVTNQSGIARGYYGHAEVEALHARLAEELALHGVRIDAFYYCPHHPDFGERIACDCRKPGIGMFERACRELAVDVAGSWMIGDKLDDLEFAARAGLRAILIAPGPSSGTGAAHVAANLVEAARIVLGG